MAAKYEPTGIVHKGTNGSTTGCGFNTNDNKKPLGKHKSFNNL